MICRDASVAIGCVSGSARVRPRGLLALDLALSARRRSDVYLNMTEIISTVIEYMGEGFVPVVYVIALIALFRLEKDRAVRMIFGWLPLLILVAFLLPPAHTIYSKVDGADTYYRILWMLPMIVTIAACGVRVLRERLLLGTAILCVVAVVSGRYMYTASNTNLVAAENRLHIPNDVIRVCDTITNDAAGEETMAAVPAELVQFVRQYDSRIDLAYGREMLMPQYSRYTANAVYEAMEREDSIDAEALASACRQYSCSYIVINASRTMVGDLTDYGCTVVTDLGSYVVYRMNTEDTNLH